MSGISAKICYLHPSDSVPSKSSTSDLGGGFRGLKCYTPNRSFQGFMDVPPLKTNMTNWKIPIFNRRYIFIHGCFSIVLVSFRGKNIKVNLEWIPL